MAAAKSNFKVVGLAEAVNGADIEVMVKATSAANAKEEAVKKNPMFSKHKDVRVYAKSGWVRVA